MTTDDHVSAGTMDREATLVELVDENGSRQGATTVDAAHRRPGLLHRAFSVLLLDPAGRILLQRRSAVKTRFALRWANACCGHPAPGQAVTAAAAQRLTEELGIHGVPLTAAGVFRYQATDPATGRAEHEYDHVLFAEVPAGQLFAPDPAEIAEIRWSTHDQLIADLAAFPARYAPWLSGVVATWTATLDATSTRP
jgi:isopentenyl-diphosphate Delta-isomerase